MLLCHRVNLPKRKRRDRLKELERVSPRESFVETDVETASEASSEQDYSYEFAQMEVIMKTLGNNGMIKIICIMQNIWPFRVSGHSRISVSDRQNPAALLPQNLTFDCEMLPGWSWCWRNKQQQLSNNSNLFSCLTYF